MLEGEIVLVTDASHGIGRQIALTLDRESVAIIVSYNDSATRAEEVVKEVRTAGGRIETVQCDISDFESCGRMVVDMVSRYGCLDILVSNAGIIRGNLLMKMSEEDFDAAIDTNSKDVFNCIRHVSHQMLKQRVGRIINVSSISGILNNAGQANYCAIKASIIGITRSAAKELTSRGITVSAVAPGFIAMEMTDVLSDSVKAVAMEQIPVKHFGSTQDVTEAVAFLAPDKAGHITGQVLGVDGGMAMQDAPAYVLGCKRTGMRLI